MKPLVDIESSAQRPFSPGLLFSADAFSDEGAVPRENAIASWLPRLHPEAKLSLTRDGVANHNTLRDQSPPHAPLTMAPLRHLDARLQFDPAQ